MAANKYDEVAQKVRDRKRQQKTTTTSFNGGDDQLNNQLSEARGAVASQIKAYVVAGGIQDALIDISNGNFGTAANDALAMLNNVITMPLQVEVELLQESFSQKNLLPPSLQSNT
jgi:hypothetical protein